MKASDVQNTVVDRVNERTYIIRAGVVLTFETRVRCASKGGVRP
jgi:hypothetical protein